MANATDPNDPYYANDPNHWVYVNGQWNYRNDQASSNPSKDPTNNGGDTSIGAGTTGTGDFFGSGKTSIGNATADAFNGAKDKLNAILHPQDAEIAALNGAPGSSLDTTQSNEDSGKMNALIGQLQQQAQTGNGAWQQTLAQSQQQAAGLGSALGQSNAGTAMGVGNQARSIGNAQGAAAQQAVGQGNILRAQTQQQSAGNLAGALGAQQGAEADQSATNAAVLQNKREVQRGLEQERLTNDIKGIQGAAQLAESVAALSVGGPVPGKPKVFGDSEKNDTVPAVLSPGEIVIPRSIAQSPDAAAKAAAFVAQVKAKHSGEGVHHFDGGGSVPPPDQAPQYGQDYAPTKPRDPTARYDDNDTTGNLGGGSGLASLLGLQGPTTENASTINGALLQTQGYNQARDANLQNQAFLAQMAAGKGPSVAPQQVTNANDAAASSALAGGKLNPNAIGAAVAGAGQGGGNAAATAGQEQQRAIQATSQSIAEQRSRDLAFAKAQQQAAWTNSLTNIGLTQQQQALLRGQLAAAGQGAVGAAGLLKTNGNPESEAPFTEGDAGNNKGEIDAAFNEPDAGEYNPSSSGDYSPPDVSEGSAASQGGEVVSKKAKAFLRAMEARQ